MRSQHVRSCPSPRLLLALGLPCILLLALGCGAIGVQTVTSVRDDESSQVTLFVVIQKALLDDPDIATRWSKHLELVSAYLSNQGMHVEPYDDERTQGLRAAILFDNLTTLNKRLSGKGLSLFDSFALRRWRGAYELDARISAHNIRQRIMEITRLSEEDIVSVNAPLRVRIKLPGVPVTSNADILDDDKELSWIINWMDDTVYTLNAVNKVAARTPAITEPASGARIKDDVEGGIRFAGTGEPGADITLYRTEGAQRQKVGTTVVDARGTWEITSVPFVASGEYGFLVEQSIGQDRLISSATSITYRPITPIVFVPGYWSCRNNLQGLILNDGKELLNSGNRPAYYGPLIANDLQFGAVEIYDPLFHYLITKVGYELNKNLFVACYDWTGTMDDASVRLGAFIQRAYARNGRPVTIVTHSTGGLLARYYIQNHPTLTHEQVGDLIMVGPPNHGVGRVYYTWEGGDLSQEEGTIQSLTRFAFAAQCDLSLFPPLIKSSLPRNPIEISATQQKVYACAHRSVPLQSPANPGERPIAQWFLPDWELLQTPAGPRRDPESLVQALNTPEQIRSLFEGIRGSVTIIAGKSVPTLYQIPVTAPSADDSGRWANGKPSSQIPVKDEGDNTVRFASAGLPEAQVFASRYQLLACEALGEEISMSLDCNHVGGLISAATVKVGQILREQAATEFPAVTRSDWIEIWVQSPVNVLVTDSSGRRFGRDAAGQLVSTIPDTLYGETADPLGPKVMILPQPLAGAYRFDLTGIGSGEYKVYAMASNSDAPLLAETGTIQAGEARTYHATYVVPGTPAAAGDMIPIPAWARPYWEPLAALAPPWAQPYLPFVVIGGASLVVLGVAGTLWRGRARRAR